MILFTETAKNVVLFVIVLLQMQISVSDTGSMTSQLSLSTYYGLIKLLSTCVTGSHSVAENLLRSGISGTLHNLLRRYVPLIHTSAQHDQAPV